MSYLDMFVEGKSDFHVIKNLLKKHQIPIEKEPDQKNRKESKKIYVRGFGDNEYTGRGIESLKKAFKKTLESENAECVWLCVCHACTVSGMIQIVNGLSSLWDGKRPFALYFFYLSNK